jgi:hypothetical protein
MVIISYFGVVCIINIYRCNHDLYFIWYLPKIFSYDLVLISIFLSRGGVCII